MTYLCASGYWAMSGKKVLIVRNVNSYITQSTYSSYSKHLLFAQVADYLPWKAFR